jgi:hypothetical protein
LCVRQPNAKIGQSSLLSVTVKCSHLCAAAAAAITLSSPTISGSYHQTQLTASGKQNNWTEQQGVGFAVKYFDSTSKVPQ